MTPAALRAQCSDPEQAKAVMHKAISLATDSARSAPDSGRRPRGVALSMGSFGSTLSPGQEYAGVYPWPYGPRAPDTAAGPLSPEGAAASESELASGPAGGPASEQEQQANEQALFEFHLARLQAYGALDAVGWLAFETVPSLAEIGAIRRAVGAWRTWRNEGPRPGHVRADEPEGSDAHATAAAAPAPSAATDAEPGSRRDRTAGPKFWIASAFPAGSLGERPNGPHGVGAWLEALLGEGGGCEAGAGARGGGDPGDQGGGEGGAAPLPVPDGLGINCTHPSFLPALLAEVEARVPPALKAEMALVVYPDGGCVYDVTTRRWTEKEGSPAEWARGLVELVKDRGGWGEVLVGGCCKTGPEEIRALRRAVDELQR